MFCNKDLNKVARSGCGGCNLLEGKDCYYRETLYL